jgi:hypothetical protein
VQLHSFLTSALDGGEWSVSRPGRFTPEELWLTGGWVGPRDDLHVVDKRKTLVPDKNLTPDRAARSLVSTQTVLF